MNHALSFPRPSGSSSWPISSLRRCFFLLAKMTYLRLAREHVSWRNENPANDIAAEVYFGAPENDPRIQAANMPPRQLAMLAVERATARRFRGATLLAIHAPSAGAAQKDPGREKNNEAYLIETASTTRNKIKPKEHIPANNIDTSPLHWYLSEIKPDIRETESRDRVCITTI